VIFSHWGCLRTGCRGEHDRRGMKWREVGGNCKWGTS
jgi:hypothetical protein